MNFISKCIYKSKQLTRAYIFKDEKEMEALKWLRDSKRKQLRYDYPLTKDSIVFDCGGYKGDFCTQLLKENPKVSIYVFELVKSYTDFMVKKFSNTKNVNIYNFGIGDRNYDLTIEVNELHSSTYTTNADAKKEICKIVNVEDFMRAENIVNIDLIKLNIEGGEYDLLDYLINRELINSFKYIQVQFHNYGNWSVERRNIIRKNLRKTHKIMWSYDWIFESWERL